MKNTGKINLAFGDYSNGLDYKNMAQEMNKDLTALQHTFGKMSEQSLLEYYDTKVGQWKKMYPLFDQGKLYLAINSVVNSKRN
jgi:hypothetical protein